MCVCVMIRDSPMNTREFDMLNALIWFSISWWSNKQTYAHTHSLARIAVRNCEKFAQHVRTSGVNTTYIKLRFSLILDLLTIELLELGVFVL